MTDISSAGASEPRPTGSPQGLAPMAMTGGVMIFAGVVSVIAGLLAIFVPGPTLVFIAIVTGVNLIVIGILGLVELIVGDLDEQGSKGVEALVCALALVAGLVVLRHPSDSVLAVTVALGVWFVLAGVFKLVAAPFAGEGRLWRVVSSLGEIALGAVILALPDVSLKTLAVLVGIGFCIRGVAYVVEGWQLRHEPAG